MISIVIWVVRIGLAGVLIYAGVMKLKDPAAFTVEIQGYRLAPKWIAQWLAVYLPWLELLIGMGILLPWTARGSAVLQAILLTVFTLALASAWWRGLDITCGCFGKSRGTTNFMGLILRDLGLLFAAVCVLLRCSQRSPQSIRLL